MRIDETIRRITWKNDGIKRRVFWILAIGRGRKWASAEIAHILWDGELNGGPEWDLSYVRNIIWQIRRSLKRIGSEWYIHTHGWDGYELRRR